MNIVATIGILIFLWYLFNFGKQVPFKPLWMAKKESPVHLLMWFILIISVIILMPINFEIIEVIILLILGIFFSLRFIMYVSSPFISSYKGGYEELFLMRGYSNTAFVLVCIRELLIATALLIPAVTYFFGNKLYLWDFFI